MNYTTGIYWLTRLDSVNNLSIGLFATGIVITLIYFLVYGVNQEWWDKDERKEYKDNHKGKIRWGLFLTIVGVLGMTFTPTTKEAIFIVAGGKTLEYAAKDTSLQKIPGQLTNITSTWLESKLNELQTDVKEEIKNR